VKVSLYPPVPKKSFMAVDYAARKAAKKQRRRISSNGNEKKKNFDGAAGGEGGSSGKDKKQRPKRGRSGPRRLCQGMCYQVPKVRIGGEERKKKRG